MKKTIISVIVTIIMLFASTALCNAAVILNEGENYSSISFKGGIRADLEFSNNAIFVFQNKMTEGVTYAITYKVNAQTAGSYNLYAASTVLNNLYTTDYSVNVNGQIIKANTSAVLEEDIKSEIFPNVLKKYKLGTVNLQSGENIVTFLQDTKDVRTDGLLVFYLDYFYFEKPPFDANGITPGMPNGIFEENDDVLFDFVYNTSPTKEKIEISLIDFWGNEAFNKIYACTPLVQSEKINLGKLPTGWYQMAVKSGGILIYETCVSIVPSFSLRTKEDSPFGTDLASGWLLESAEQTKNFARAARLAGIKWVRERYTWTSIEPTKNHYKYDAIENNINILVNDGLNVLDVFHDAAPWYKNSSECLAGDLFDIYNFQKNIAMHFGDKVKAWEIWNEPDGGFSEVPADVYASFYKAAALGICQANSKPILSGLCTDTNDVMFSDLLIKNNVLHYSLGYNFHKHNIISGEAVQNVGADFLNKHISLAGKHPVWITEAGLAIKTSTLSILNLRAQARYAVTSTVQSLASGVDKYFWFILPHYTEGMYEFGSFTEKGEANPVYASEAVMTSVLGTAKYQGKLNSDTTEGYLFSNGMQDVLVVWSPTETRISINSKNSVEIVNLMGKRTTFQPRKGVVDVIVTAEPSYIIFGEKMDRTQITASLNTTETPFQKPEEQVILQVKYDGKNLKQSRDYGYILEHGETTTANVTAYNFSNKPITTTLTARGDGFDFSGNDTTIVVSAMDKVSVPIKIKPNKQIVSNRVGYITFEAAGASSTTTAVVVYADNDAILLSGIANGASYEKINKVVATLPDDSYKNVKIRINQKEHLQYLKKNNVLDIYLSDLQIGSYKMSIYAETETGYIYRKNVDFHISGISSDYNIFIEGENLPNQKSGYFSTDYAGCSQGKCGVLSGSAPCKIEVKFNAQREGMYTMKFKATRNSYVDNYLSPYQVTLNGNEWELQKSKESMDIFGIYSLNVFLQKGENTICFTPKRPRELDGKYLIYFDYLSFEYLINSNTEILGLNYSGKNSTTTVDINANQAAIYGPELPVMEYVLYAPETGAYTMNTTCSALQNRNTNDWILVVDDKMEYYVHSENTTLLSTEDGITAYQYNLNNTVYLKQGYNKILVKADPNDTNTPASHLLYLTGIYFAKELTLKPCIYEKVHISSAKLNGDQMLVNLANNTQEDFQLIAASYTGNKLNGVQFIMVSGIKPFVCYDITIPKPGIGDKIKIYAWDSMWRMQAFSNGIELK